MTAILYSQRRELSRVTSWLRSHRFTQDFEMGAIAEYIAKCIEDGTYESERPDEPTELQQRGEKGPAKP